MRGSSVVGLWREDVSEDEVGGAQMSLNVVKAHFTAARESVGIGSKRVDDLCEFIGVSNAKSAAARYQVGCFLEFLVVRSDDYRNAIDSRLVDVVDTGPESATHVGHLSILIKRGEDSEAVDYEAIHVVRLVLGHHGVELRRSCDAAHESLQTVVVELVRCDDEFHLGV